ncbi:MAG: hypothetical protein AAFX45_12355 [Pseudomonadota bacterium]
MPSLTLDDRLVWFAHCPKAGGTSVEAAMVARWGDRVGHLHWGWDRWWRRGGWRTANPPNSPQHLIWADAQKVLPRAPDAVFAMVRDPVARITSEQRYQRHQRHATLLGRALAWLPFGVWLRLMLAMARRNPHAFDNHLRPQSDFIPPGAAMFRLEDGVHPALTWLAEISGARLAETAPHRLKSKTGPAAIRPAEQALIGAAFAVDYARFDYPLPTASVPRRGGLDLLAEALAPVCVWFDRRGKL